MLTMMDLMEGSHSMRTPRGRRLDRPRWEATVRQTSYCARHLGGEIPKMLDKAYDEIEKKLWIEPPQKICGVQWKPCMMHGPLALRDR